MFFKESEIQERLSSPNNLAVKLGIISPVSNIPVSDGIESIEVSISELPESNLAEHKRCGSGRTLGTKNRTDAERCEIAEDAAIFGPTRAAELHDCSVSQAHSYAHGFSSSGNRGLKPEVGKSAVNSIEEVRQRAIDKILAAMDLITVDKLDNLTAPSIAQTALSLSRIPSNLESRQTDDINRGNTVNVVVYSPPVKEEKQYKTIKIA